MAAAELVARSHAREDAIDDADAGPGGRHEAAHLGEQRQESDLTNESRFARHIRPGDQPELAVRRTEAHIVGHEGPRRQGLLEHGVAAVADFQDRLLAQLRPNILARNGKLGKTGQGVERGEDLGGLHEPTRLRRHLVSQRQK